MTEQQAQTVAALIVTDIMQNASGKADRLVLTIDAANGKPARDLGGWGRAPLIDRIAKNLARMRIKQATLPERPIPEVHGHDRDGRRRAPGWGAS